MGKLDTNQTIHTGTLAVRIPGAPERSQPFFFSWELALAWLVVFFHLVVMLSRF